MQLDGWQTYPNQQPFLKRGPTFQFCQFCLQLFFCIKLKPKSWIEDTQRCTVSDTFFLEGRKMDIHRVWLIYHAPWKKNGTALEIFQKHQRQDWRKRWKDWGPPAVSLGPALGTPVDPSRFCNAAENEVRGPSISPWTPEWRPKFFGARANLLLPSVGIRGAAIPKKHKVLTNVHGDAEKRYTEGSRNPTLIRDNYRISMYFRWWCWFIFNRTRKSIELGTTFQVLWGPRTSYHQPLWLTGN